MHLKSCILFCLRFVNLILVVIVVILVILYFPFIVVCRPWDKKFSTWNVNGVRAWLKVRCTCVRYSRGGLVLEVE